MALPRRRPPPAPTRATPSPGPLSRITDPHLHLLLRQLFDRLGKADQDLQDLRTFALRGDAPVNAYSQRVTHVGAPEARDDAVPLWYLKQVLAGEAAVRRQQDAAGAAGAGGGAGAGSNPPTVPLADLYGEVVAYANAHPADFANSCQDSGGSWAFMDGLVAHLQGIDPRVGFNGKRGDVNDPSKDALSYYHGVMPPVAGSHDVYVVDVIARHCTPEAAPAWQNVTTPAAAGAWLPTRA